MVPVDFCEEGEADEKAYFGQFDDHEIYTYHTIPTLPLEVFGIFFWFLFSFKDACNLHTGAPGISVSLRVG
jgi:hypothetical protein